MEASTVPRVAPAGVATLASPGLLRLLSDDRLVALIRDGNSNAFEAVYDRHNRAILSFCRHMLGCADEAEDAVQHTFLAAYNGLVSSRKPIHLRAWLFTIARNRCLSILRARRERTALEFEEPATDGLAVQVQRRQDLRDLVADINHLPHDQRSALVLAEIGALGHDEIGSVIGVPRDKVKALIFQARESLLADRAARDADCQEIREQLATMRGAALRRTTLRRHLRECQGCREYRYEVERQRRRIAAILPVLPTLALRKAVLGAAASSGAGVAGGGVLGASSLLKGVAGKSLFAALVAAAGTTGTILVVHDFRLRGTPAQHHLLRGYPSTSILAPVTAPLAPRRAPDPDVAGTRSTDIILLAGLTGPREAATAKALVHALTGQLSNLLRPVLPHAQLVSGIGAVTSSGAQTAPPAGAVPTSVPVIMSPAPTVPGSVTPAAGSGGSSWGSYGAGPPSGGRGPSGLSATSGTWGSSGGSGWTASPGQAGTGTPSNVAGTTGPASGGRPPSSVDGGGNGATGSGSASPASAPGAGNGSGPNSGSGPGCGSGSGGGGGSGSGSGLAPGNGACSGAGNGPGSGNGPGPGPGNGPGPGPGNGPGPGPGNGPGPGGSPSSGGSGPSPVNSSGAHGAAAGGTGPQSGSAPGLGAGAGGHA